MEKRNFKVGDEVTILKWHYAKIRTPQNGTILHTNTGSGCPYEIMIEEDQYGTKDAWFFREDEFELRTPEFSREFKVGDKVVFVYPEIRDEDKEAASEGVMSSWARKSLTIGSEYIISQTDSNSNIKVYGCEHNFWYNKYQFLHSEDYSKLNSKTEKTMKVMKHFVIKGSDVLKVAIAKEIMEEANVPASSGLIVELNRNVWNSSSHLGVYEDGIGYYNEDGEVFQLPQDYMKAKEYAVSFFKNRQRYLIDGYELKVNDTNISFGCKNFTLADLNKITDMMHTLDYISDSGHRDVVLDRSSITIGDKTLNLSDINDFKSLLQ